ncbi:hypothetical protein [Methylobacterium sp. JK268]
MVSRLVAASLSVLLLATALPAAAQDKPASPPKEKKEPTASGLAARERQKKCGTEWRALSAAEKTAQGPKWPQYFSKCVKRLKEQRA